MPEQNIAGLLPGVELVRIGVAGPDEFEQVGDLLYKGPRGFSQVIVKLKEGFTARYNITDNSFRVVTAFPVRVFIAKFEATSDDDLAVLERVKGASGFVSMEEVKAPAAGEALST